MATQSSKTTTATQPAKQPEPWGTITFKAHPAKPLSINSADGITVTYAQNKGKEDFTTMTITAMSDPSVQCVKPRTEGNAFIANFEAANANALKTATDKEKPFGDKFKQDLDPKNVATFRNGTAVVFDPLFTKDAIQALCPSLKLPATKGK